MKDQSPSGRLLDVWSLIIVRTHYRDRQILGILNIYFWLLNFMYNSIL